MSAVVFIPLTQGRVAVIDFEDFDKVRSYKWSAKKSKTSQIWYARTNMWISGKRTTRNLHQVILPGYKEIDHKDGNGLNNRRQNLRGCIGSENHWAFRTKRPNATSQFRGVSWFSKNSIWKSEIEKAGKHYYLGCFKTETAAAHAYDVKARELFGEFASLNFPL